MRRRTVVGTTSKVISGPGTLARLIATLSKKAKVTAAIAYVTDPMGLELKAGDRIYVNCLDSTISSGGTDPRVLEKWARAGVEVLHCEELHAKVVVAGRWTAIGSANLSQRANRVQEALWIGTDQETRSQALTFLNSLADVSVEVDARWLRAKRGLFGTTRTSGSGARRRGDHERRPHSVLPVKVTRLHLAYGESFKADQVPKYVASAQRAARPTARFQGIVGGWPRGGAEALRTGDLLVWLEAPSGREVGKGEPPGDLGLMDAPLLITARPQRAGQTSSWFLAEYDNKQASGLPLPPLSKAHQSRLWAQRSIMLTKAADIDRVLAAWSLTSAPTLTARVADREATLPF